MTINNTSNKAILQGNGATTIFNFNFVAVAAQYISVYYTDPTGNVSLINPLNYTLAINAPAGGIWGIGGSVTYNPGGVPIPTGSSLTILRTLTETQQTTISNQSAFYANVVEAMGDYITMLTQQIAEVLNRSVALSITSAATAPVLATPVAGSFLAYNNDATQIVPVNALAPFSLQDGTIALPGLSFNSQPTLGLYKNASNVLGVVANTGIVALFTNPATAVNYLQVQGAATGNAISLSALGSDTNIDITLTPKGSGKVNMAGTNITGSNIPANGTYLPAANTLGIAVQSLLALKIIGVASVVNNWYLQGAITSGVPLLGVEGTDTNISLGLVTKGTGALKFATGSASNIQLQVEHTASAVNYIGITGFPTGGGPSIYAKGSDTNINLFVYSQGNGTIFFSTGSAANIQFAVLQGSASTVNYIYLSGSATGAIPGIGVTGTDTNISLNLITKGTGALNIYTGGGTSVGFQVTHTASGVNYIAVTGSTTGNTPNFLSTGNDTNIGIVFSTKGTGSYLFYTGGFFGKPAFGIVDSGTTAVNYLSVAGGATGAAPQLLANGTDSNVDITLTAKGTGLLKMGLASMTIANAAVATVLGSVGPTGSHTTVQEWLQVKNSAGTVRYIPCF